MLPLRLVNLEFHYHVDLRKHLRDFIPIKDEFIHEPYSTWTAVGVSELVTPGALVEVRIIAKREWL